MCEALFKKLEQLPNYERFTKLDNHNQKTNILKCMFVKRADMFESCHKNCSCYGFCPEAYRIGTMIFGGNPHTFRTIDVTASDHCQMQEPASLVELIKLKQNEIKEEKSCG
jgi:Fe-S-cluster containining protein